MQRTESRTEYVGINVRNTGPLVLVQWGTGAPIKPPSQMAGFLASEVPLAQASLVKSYEERYPRTDQDLANGNTRDSWNYFEHYKLTNNFGDAAIALHTNFYHPYYLHQWVAKNGLCMHDWQSTLLGPVDKPITGLNTVYERNAVTGNFVKRIPNIDSVVKQSLKTMLGEVRPQQSALNNLWELKDMKTLPRTIQRLESSLRELQKKFPKILKTWKILYPKGGRKSFIELLGSLSDVFLQKEFNLEPLISDITGVRDALKSEQMRIAKLIANAGIRQRRDYRLSLGSYYKADYSTSQNAAGFTLIRRRCAMSAPFSTRIVTYPEAEFHAQIEYTYWYSQWQQQNAAVLSILDKMGIMFDPSIVWNAIPWSFAVDWVIDVSRFLKQYRMANMEPLTVIHKFCWSQRVQRQITCMHQVVHTNPSQVPPTPTVTINSCFEEAYVRSPSGLNITAALTGSGINPKEFILASALFLSKKRK